MMGQRVKWRGVVYALVVVFVVVGAGCSRRVTPKVEATDFRAADALIEGAIEEGLIPGAVLLVGRGGQVLHRKAYGLKARKPRPEAMTTETLFDLASLTKPIATSTSIMVLVQRGEVDLQAPAANYLPGFEAGGKGAITVEQLLLHQSGLTPDNHLRDYADGAAVAYEKINALETRWPIGEGFHYSDVGYIALGKIVEEVSGERLHTFAWRHVFAPLGMRRTSFLPPLVWRDEIAPTAYEEGRWLRGAVHDPRAAALGGVAGHAGLFSNADDLGRYCQMMLGAGGDGGDGGDGGGGDVLSAETLDEMRRVRFIARALKEGEEVEGGAPKRDARNLGFDVDTAYSSAGGALFETLTTFGHTGFTGPAFWIDPPNGTYYVFLCSRLHGEEAGSVVGLRRQIATAVAEAIEAGR